MFITGDIIDSRYRVQNSFDAPGGMGKLLFVNDSWSTLPVGAPQKQLVLKYCTATDEGLLKRFRREVRLINTFMGNDKIVQLKSFNVDYEPPYYVMEYHEKGDLSGLSSELQGDPESQEKLFLVMIDCIAELHSRGVYHRDIKPQNFLVSDSNIIVSDFGLSMEVDSSTNTTLSTVGAGTRGYQPPEFTLHGGFKNADASSDIFMLGKSFYSLLTGRDPVYLLETGIEPPIFHVIEKACAINKVNRYQGLSELRQSLVMAYDVIIGRRGPLGLTQHLLTAITDRLKDDGTYDPSQVSEFVEKLALLDVSDKVKICMEVDDIIYYVLRQLPVVGNLPVYLSAYKEMVEKEEYSWSHAEIVASNMNVIFSGEDVPNSTKCKALEIAIDAAYRMNRFAAMDTCKNMIRSVNNNILGSEVAAVLLENPLSFIADIEPSECKSEQIKNALFSINKEE